jgi:hypothetical protein
VSAALSALDIADPAESWAALGFDVRDRSVWLDGIELRLGRAGTGIVGWSLAGIAPLSDLDGLATEVAEAGPRIESAHENGAIGVDHVVVLSSDFERTASALSAAGLELRRIREVPGAGIRQGFRRLGPAILELVEARDAPAGPARFWGLVVVVRDLDALAERLGDRLGQTKPAVQPGRRIATLRQSAGLSPAVAFMDPG